jgi:eukaryotic-like serine/threonine-protein kinase
MAFALAVAAAAACAAPAVGKPPPSPPPGAFAPPPTGTLAVCNTSGPRPVTGTFTFTLSTVASAGGTQVLSIPVGACATQIFYPIGATVTVIETVPTGDTVAAISLAGGESKVASSTLAAGTAAVAIGAGQAVLTFQTNAPLPRCVVPNVVGLTLTNATTSLRKHSCRVGVLRRVYSATVRAGRVIRESPGRGSNLAPNAPVALVLSRGRRP